jgi:hypothetical protein
MEIRQPRVQRLVFRTSSECATTNLSASKQYGRHFEMSHPLRIFHQRSRPK